MGCCSQYGRLLIVFLKLKSWRFLFMLVVFAALVSNIYLYSPVDAWVLRLGEKDLQIVGGAEFQAANALLADTSKYGIQINVISNTVSRISGENFRANNLETCDSVANCQDKYFQMLLGKKQGKLVHYIDYYSETTKRAKLQCQLATGSELYCPFMAYLVGISQPINPMPDYQFKSPHVFRLMSTIEIFQKATQGNKTICKTDANFPVVFPKTVMVQTILIVLCLVFYILVSSVSCINELKRNGFLQLLCRRSLSVIAFWLALWTVTLLEMAIFAAVLTVSYSLQCSGFYPTSQLINIFLNSFVQFCGVASVIYFFTVLTRSRVIVSLFSCLLFIIAASIIVVNRIVLPKNESMRWIRYIFLVVPIGHMAEQMYETLLKGLIPANSFIGLVMPVSAGLFGVMLILTIYLDCVFKSGCGLHMPGGFVCASKYYSLSGKDRVNLDMPPHSEMIEEVSEHMLPVVCTNKISKSYKTCVGSVTQALKCMSAVFYQDQITAIVGHNGSGKSTLLQILAGERKPSTGSASMLKTLITDPLSRYHIGKSIGYCPQTDALCDRLTVMDTLKLTASSSDLSWGDVYVDLKYILTTLQIDDKTNHCINSLSSSDKRKVCVTMALIGKPKVLLLDNPSRDMDYISRRRLWSLLHEYKQNRSIIVSTLFIDEADSIADRMLFLVGGRMICAGSPFFFKRAFDCRFIIQIASKTEFHVPFIIRRIASKFSAVRVRSVAHADVELEIPISHDEILPQVAAEVENMSEVIDEFGIANYSLDDVFSRLKTLPPSEVENHFQHGTVGYIADDVDRIRTIQFRPKFVPPDGPSTTKISPSMLSTILAIIQAQFRQLRRSKERLLVRLIVPIVLLVMIAVAGVVEKRAKNDEYEIKFDLSDTTDYERHRGTCFYYITAIQSKMHLDTIRDPECSLLLTGVNKTAMEMRAQPLDIGRYTYGDFKEAILDKTQLSNIKGLCKKASLPCPIIYSNDWCPDNKNVENDEVYVGAYADSANYTAQTVAMTAIEIYKNAIGFTTRRHYKNNTQRPDFDVEGILDIKGIFFPFYGTFFLMILLAVIPAFCLNDVIQDRKSGIRTQLMTMGMSRFHYWLSTLLAQWIQVAVIYVLGVVLLIIIISKGYSNVFYLVGVLPLTLLIGLVNSLLCVYSLSTFVHNVSYLATSVYLLFCFVISMSALVVQSHDVIGRIMIFLLPQFAIIAPSFYGIRFIFYSLSFYKATTDGNVPSLLSYYFTVPHTRDALIALIVHFVLLILLLVLVENRHKLPCCKGAAIAPEKGAYEHCDEANIVEEVSQLEKNPRNGAHLIEVSHLKVVNSEGKAVVRDISFGLKPGDTYALLGPCGSGKSATVRAIIGDQVKSAGRIDFQLKDRWLSNIEATQQRFIGYCPVYDPQFQRLTVRENLEFYAKSIGVPGERAHQVVRNFRLDTEVNTISMYATAGVRRRLTLAIAVLADPKFLAIDEASAGVDPEGRQMLWQNMKSLCIKQRSLLVTTQYMEEAETLCNRICILNGGMMAALNSIDELIHRYKRMYFLEVQIAEVPNETTGEANLRKDKLVDIIAEKFYGTVVIDQFTSRIQFGIPIKSIGRLSTALSWILGKKAQLNLLYFTFHYATIDQTMKAIVVHHDGKMLRQYEQAETAAA